MAEKENLKSHMRAHSTSRERTTAAGTALQSATQAPEYFSVQRLLGDRPLGGGTRVRVSSRGQQVKSLASPHPCPVCGGRFTRAADLALHLGKVHDIKTDIVDAGVDATTDRGGDVTVTERSLRAADTSPLAIIHHHQIYRDHDVHSSPAPALSVK